MTVKIQYLFRDAGDHIAFRDGSFYVVDNRDKRGLDGKPIYDSNGKPLFHGAEPPWNPPGHFLPQVVVEKAADEIAFDHMPTKEELAAAFPNFKKPIDTIVAEGPPVK